MSKYSVPDAGDEDIAGAARTASHYAGDAGEESFFGDILGSIMGRQQNLAAEELDEDKQQHLIKQHQAVFGNGGDDNQSLGASSLGGAAAMQALKMFTSGQQMTQAGQGGAQNAFVGMAMGEAAKLFEAQKAQGSTDPAVTKDSAVEHAAETALKMYLQSQGSGGGSGLMGLAGKFL